MDLVNVREKENNISKQDIAGTTAESGSYDPMKLLTDTKSLNQNGVRNLEKDNHEIPFEAPDNIDKSIVTTMKAGDFGNCTAIDALAFYGYQNLETIELPGSITKIKQFAFAKLPKLKEVIIPDGEIEIDSYAFFSCKNLKRVRLPEGLTEIKTGTFSDCKKLSRIRIPDSVTKIEDYAFFACGKSFKATNVPQNATIASAAFPKGRKSYSQKKAKPRRCCFKKRRNDGIVVNPPIIQNNPNLNYFYNDGLGSNVNKPNLDMGSVMTRDVPEVSETIPVANISIPSVEESTYDTVDSQSIEAAANTVDSAIIIEPASIMEPETTSELIIGTNPVVSPNWPDTNNILNGSNVNETNSDMESIIIENAADVENNTPLVLTNVDISSIDESDTVEPATTIVEELDVVEPAVTPVEEPATVEPTYVEDNSVISNEVPIDEDKLIAWEEEIPKSEIEITLDEIFDKVNAKSIGAENINEVNNTRVETDEKLLERLVNLYMITALNISTPYIYNKSGLTQRFRLFDGNRSEITMEKENGVERVKHNVDRGEGSSNMMRILYPSSAGTLAIEGGYIEAFKKDCAPTAELMGEIVAHLYKYRKNKDISIRDKFESKDTDTKSLRSISAYLSAKDEMDPETKNIIKGAEQIRNEIRVDLAGDRKKNQSVLVKLVETFKDKPRNLAALNNLQSIPKDIEEIRGSQNKDAKTKYNDIMTLIAKKEAALKKREMTKKEFTNYGIIKGKLEMKIEEADIQAIEKALGFVIDRNVVKIGKKFSEPINAYKDKVEADKNKEEKIREPFTKASTLAKSLIDEFPSLQFTGKESLTTFIALIKNAETMIDQESNSENGDKEKLIPKYTTERMLMTYVLKEFGNTSSLNKFYDKVQAAIPIEEREDAKEASYTKKLNVLQKAIETFEGNKYNLNSPYKKEMFGYASASQFKLTKDENGKKAKTGDNFPDCADTASRHLINLLSYDGEENGWNYIYDKSEESRLEEISNKVLGAIKENKEIDYDSLEDRVKAFYYYQNKSGADNGSAEGHTFWNYVISNMNAVEGEGSPYYNLGYNKGNNELLPGYINFLKLAYNIAYALKAGKALKTANGTAYDGADGQLIKAKEAINALLGDNYKKSIEELKPLLQTAMTKVFSLYNKELNDVKFDGLNKGGRAGNDIVAKGESKFNINRAKNQKDSLNFGMMMDESHAETHHSPQLFQAEFSKEYEGNPQIMMLPGMKASNKDKKRLSSFDILFTASQGEVIEENVKNSKFYDKIALQNMINIIGDEGILSTMNNVKLLKLMADSEGSIKINRINKVKDKNGKDIEIPEKPTDLAKELKTRFVETMKKQDDYGIKKFMNGIVSSSKKIMGIPKYSSIVYEILNGANGVYKSGEDYYHFDLEGDGVRLDNVLSKTGNIKLPKEVELDGNKYPVKSIYFEFNDSVVGVDIPDSISLIGTNCFRGCSNLAEVKLPANLESIKNWAFAGCGNLKNITIPDSVKSIGNYTFNGCKKLENVKLSTSLTEISKGIFEDCDSLKSVIIPNSVKSIEEEAFCNCKKLENVEMSNSVTKIYSEAFKHCDSLKSITLPANLTKLDSSSFAFCSSLESITIPASIAELSSYVFRGCSKLKEVKIQGSKTPIRYGAFEGCHNLTSIEIAEDLYNKNVDYIWSEDSSTLQREDLGNGRIKVTKLNQD